MPPAYLVEETDQRGETRVAVGEYLAIGRASACGFVLRDASASRRHMEIRLENSGYTWRDLDSTNGIFVNEEKSTEGRLAPGDRIRIGDTVLVFEVGDIPPPGGSGLDEKIIDRLEESHAEGGGAEAIVLLEAVHAVMNDIASNYEPCSLVDRILETTMKAIDAQRGAVFFAGSGDSLEPCDVCGHVHVIEDGTLKHAGRDTIEVSETVARKVLRGGESVLIRDVERDAQLDTAASVVALNLRSIICVPLRGKYGILGILYIDTNRQDSAYTDAHMLLSTAVGNSAGLAIENARLHQDILDTQRMEQEIELAATIQDGFLVHEWPEDGLGVSIFAESCPAKMMGGDFYDYIRLASGKIALLIADVSGKGVPAALTMAQVLTEFRLHAVQEKPLLNVVELLNVAQCERSRRGMFCTLLFLVFDPETGACEAVNAGHHPVLCVGLRETRELASPSGPPIGVMEDAQWETESFAVAPGETLFFYTDGIVEARSADTELGQKRAPNEYGIEALRGLAEDLRGEAPSVLVPEILGDVQRYCQPLSPHDDCTLLVMRYVE